MQVQSNANKAAEKVAREIVDAYYQQAELVYESLRPFRFGVIRVPKNALNLRMAYTSAIRASTSSSCHSRRRWTSRAIHGTATQARAASTFHCCQRATRPRSTQTSSLGRAAWSIVWTPRVRICCRMPSLESYSTSKTAARQRFTFVLSAKARNPIARQGRHGRLYGLEDEIGQTDTDPCR